VVFRPGVDTIDPLGEENGFKRDDSPGKRTNDEGEEEGERLDGFL
jgi:hypothetical protein